MAKPLKIMISAGELSGDQYGADVVRALRERMPDVDVRGMGGSKLRAAGVDTVVDAEAAAGVMGFAEVFAKLGRVLQALRTMKGLIQSFRPDVLVLVDFPDFNLRLARFAKQLGIPVFYYISPKVWVWRRERIELFRRYVDHMAVVFPFEPQFLATHGFARVSYVGHPLLDRIEAGAVTAPKTMLADMNVPQDSTTLALMLGSRRSEIDKHIGPALAAVRLLKEQVPNLHVLVPVASSISRKRIEEDTHESWIQLIDGRRAHEVLQRADIGLIKSGTSNLEAALFGLPFVMYYIAHPITALIVTQVIQRIRAIPHYSIVNWIRPGTVREVVQREATAERLAKETLRLIVDERARERLRRDLGEVKDSLHVPVKRVGEASTTVAQRVAELVLTTAGADASSENQRIAVGS